jgi:hypothetical protein
MSLQIFSLDFSFDFSCTICGLKRPEKEILDRIENAFENFGQYDRIFNNCEHFATECRYGTRKSQQVSFYIPIQIKFFVREFFGSCCLIQKQNNPFSQKKNFLIVLNQIS